MFLDKLTDRLPKLKPNTQGWLICAAVLIITVVRSGITYSFGVFVVKLTNQYHTSLAEQNWIGTASFTVSLCFSPVSVAFIRVVGHHGYRIIGVLGVVTLTTSCLASSMVQSLEWMFLTHSFLYGVGSSFLYMASSLIIGEYFDKEHKHHVLATSILLCGYPVGSLVFNPLNAWLVSKYGWRQAFRVSACLIFFIGMVCVALFAAKEKPEEEEIKEKKRACSLAAFFCGSWHDVKQRPEIVLWLFANMLNYLGFFMPFLNLPYYMKLKGIKPIDSSWALTVLSLGECISYVLASLLGIFFRGKLLFCNVIASFALSLICIIWPFVDDEYAEIMGISSAMGVFLGLTIVYAYAASGEVTALPLDIAWAITNLWSGVGILIGPLFSGVIYDLRRSYDDVFYVNGGIFGLALIIYTAIIIIQKCRRGSYNIDYEDLDDRKEYERTFREIKRSYSGKSKCTNSEPSSPTSSSPGESKPVTEIGYDQAEPIEYGTMINDNMYPKLTGFHQRSLNQNFKDLSTN